MFKFKIKMVYLTKKEIHNKYNNNKQKILLDTLKIKNNLYKLF